MRESDDREIMLQDGGFGLHEAPCPVRAGVLE